MATKADGLPPKYMAKFESGKSQSSVGDYSRFPLAVCMEHYRYARACRKFISLNKKRQTPVTVSMHREQCRKARVHRRNVLMFKRCGLLPGICNAPNSQCNANQNGLQMCKKRSFEGKKRRLIIDSMGEHIPCPRGRNNKKQKTNNSYANALNADSIVEPCNFGKPNMCCGYCGALVWLKERNSNPVQNHGPKFSICCNSGKVELPLLKKAPNELEELLDYNGGAKAANFRECIRAYNSLFAFTSIGGKIDNLVNGGRGPYVFRISGQNHHRIGSLLPPEGQPPKFAQLYIYDGENEITNRMAIFSRLDGSSHVDVDIVEMLVRIFHENNEIVKMFKFARDRFQESDYIPVRLRLIESRTTDGRNTNMPNAHEVAALVPGDDIYNSRDIVVDHKSEGLKRISNLHPSFMSMQYPILFPYGEDGYRKGIFHKVIRNTKASDRNTVSMREYYAFRLQHRITEGHALLKGGKLFQQFVVDAYTCIEHCRLTWVRMNQEKLRAEVYNNIRDAVLRGDTCPTTVGKRIVLPASFTGGPRFMQQNYQDALALCRKYGHPDFFLTFTCNSKWPEIQYFMDMLPGQKPEDRPDIVARVFKLKLDDLMVDLRKGHVLGKVRAAVYTIEFQKRGLPHAHICIWLASEDKCPTPSDVDRIISAEIPDKNEDPIGYNAVAQFMMHGPCGQAKPKNPCMRDGVCRKHFPKEFNDETYVNDDGFPVYKRPDNERTVEKDGILLDNRFVVPYNRYLIVKYQAHINVEWCNRARSIKYLFKYISKGSDRATMLIEHGSKGDDGQAQQCNTVDEVKHYLDCRYISGSEACWRIFDFPIHLRRPAVQRLNFHLEDEQQVTYRESESLQGVLNRTDPEATMFRRWMKANEEYDHACTLTYAEFPEYYVWDPELCVWNPRKSGQTIGRLVYAHPTSGERFYLRMLLNVVRGAKCYKDLRTVSGVIYSSYKETCYHKGLLESDKEWHDALTEAAKWKTGQQLRQLFVTLLLYCEIANPLELWEKHWEDLSDDIEYNQRRLCQAPNLKLLDSQKKTFALYEMDLILNKHGKCLKDFPPLPTANPALVAQCSNRLLQEELAYDEDTLQVQHDELLVKLNADQKLIYDRVIDAVKEKKGGFFFVYGHGGTGKTFLWKTIMSRLRSCGHIVLAVASSGIASLLMAGGRTAHSRFKIPLDLTESMCCDIRQGTMLAELICKASLIIWDEAPMNHRYIFEVVDRTFRDILRSVDPDADQKLFGGKPFILGGDFRQILPVVPKKGREDIVMASINRSFLWDNCELFLLSKNMRLEKNFIRDGNGNCTQDFNKWMLDLGDGKLPVYDFDNEVDPSWIKVPPEFLLPCHDDPVKEIVKATFPELNKNYKDIEYVRDRAILTPRNEDVERVNSHILSSLPGEVTIYKSSDTICKGSTNVDEHELMYPSEFLNSLTFSGIPNHELQLKVGAPIMLLRNINPSKGLCNGTRLIITQLAKWVIEGRVITGNKIGTKVFIPRIIMTPNEANLPFVFKRRQFPVSICYAMTVNKSQGQTLKRVGLYLRKPVFSHGQLYVAVSRVTSPEGLAIIIENTKPEHEGYTKNIVYKEIFNNLPTGCTEVDNYVLHNQCSTSKGYTSHPFLIPDVHLEDIYYSVAQRVTKMKSSNLLSVVIKMIQEIEGLKGSQLKNICI